ncbi:MAG: hypothetical protein HZB51_25475 [Chloroflexi bacterium]|nr:hypothetical protein [Chloroflexota bacterium]
MTKSHFPCSNFVRLISMLMLVVVLCLMFPRSADAANCQWKTIPVDSTWINPNNWLNCNSGVPTSSDTVQIQAGGTQPIITTAVTLAGVTIDSGASLTIGLGGSLTLTGDFVNNGTYTYSSGAGDTIFNGTSTLSGIGSWFFRSISINSTKILNAGSTSITVAGTFVVSGTFNGDSGTVTFSGSGTVGGSGVSNFNNFVINAPSNTLNISSGRTISVSGDFTKTAGTFGCGGSNCTLNFNGTGTSAFSSTDSVNNYNITVASGKLLSTSSTFKLGRDVGGAGTFVANDGTITFNGSVAQSINGTGSTTFNNLTIANGTNGSTTFGANSTVNGALTLTTDLQVSPGISLTLGSTATCAGIGDVFGTVRRTYFITGTSYCFGNQYVSISFASGTFTSPSIDVTLVKPKPANAGFSNSVNRLYSIADSGISNFSATLRLRYLDSELNSNAEGATLALWKFIGSNTWTKFDNTNFDSTNNWVERSAITSFSSWVLANNAPASATPISIASFEAQSGGPDWSLAAIGFGMLGLLAVTGAGLKLARNR